jgi:ABC-type antimicrobial peptide transport system permease subunit
MTPREAAALVEQRIVEHRVSLTVRSESALAADVGASYMDDRIRMQATSLFGALALFLIAAGIYGLMAYAVSQRLREIGIRMAIGSTPAGILFLVLKDSARVIGFGILFGLPAALAVMRFLARFAYELPPIDPPGLIAAAGILTAAGLAAAVVPARRAARLDPVRTLRME